MAHSSRRSNRPVKLRKEQDFVYDEDSVQFLLRRGSSSESLRSEKLHSADLSGKNTLVSKFWSTNIDFTVNSVR